MIGKILGNRYRLLRELGSGGMAWVYLAEDLLDHIEVAVKVLYPQFSEDISYVQRFNREAKLATQVSSPHIVRTLNYGADRDIHYLVMENIQGQDLSTVLTRRGRLPWREALEITTQVTLALNAANAHGIVHRDIKPQNIMITLGGQVKVLDFGIARARALPSLTQTGFVGSPYYISPEQAMGEEVDIRSDIYSLGIALYEMLSGELPFDASSPWSIISQHIAKEPPRLSLEGDDLHPSVKPLLRKMLTKNPDDRYQTPNELLVALEAASQGPVRKASTPPEPGMEPRTSLSSKAHDLLLSSLYERATESEEAEEWPRAVNLMNQITKVDPSYRDVSGRLAHTGGQARLSALYAAAQAALSAERWQEAIDELGEVVGVDAGYRDAADLLTEAGKFMAAARADERITKLYGEGLAHYQEKNWQEAEHCFAQVLEYDPNHENVASFHANARKRARWASSFLGRVSRRLALWKNRPKETEQESESVLAPPSEGIREGK